MDSWSLEVKTGVVRQGLIRAIRTGLHLLLH